MTIMPKCMFWTWRDHYVIHDDGSVSTEPVGWGFHYHRYKDSGFGEREIVVWFYVAAISLTWAKVVT